MNAISAFNLCPALSCKYFSGCSLVNAGPVSRGKQGTTQHSRVKERNTMKKIGKWEPIAERGRWKFSVL